VASLSEPPGIPGMVPGVGPATSWKDCALTELIAGETPVPDVSAMIDDDRPDPTPDFPVIRLYNIH